MKQIYYNAKICQEGKIIKGAMVTENAFISAVLPEGETLPQGERYNLNGAYITPAFIDTHIHGCGGYGTDSFKAEDLLEMSKLLAKEGVCAFAPTLYPNPPEVMLKNIKALLPAFGKETGAKILGFHLEGPFISPDKLGVMKPASAAKADLNLMRSLCEAAEGKIFAVTLAPELENIGSVINFCLEHNILPQAGHTNATYGQMLNGAQSGVHHATHLFNAMRGISHREPGAAGAVILTDKFSFELIADGVHVCPEIVKMVLRLKKPQDLVLITDALKPAGTQGGLANGEEVKLEGGCFKRVSDGVTAGSALTMLKGFKNLVSWGLDIAQAAQAAAGNPARIHKLDFGELSSGKRAYFNIIDKDLNLLKTVM